MQLISRLLVALALIAFPMIALAQEASAPAELDAHEIATHTIEAFDKGQYQIGAALFVVLVAGLIRMGAVKLPGKLGEAAASKWGGRVIAIVVAQGGAIVTAMAAGKKITPGLIMAGLIAGWLGSGMRSQAPGRKRKAKAAAAPAVAALLVAAFGLQLTGCAAVYDNARRAQGVASRTVKAAGQAWEKYDQARLDQIKVETPNGAERTKRILEYANGEHADVVKVLNTAAKAIDAIDRLLDGVEAASKKDIAAALAAAAGAVDAVVDMLTKLGIKLPSEVL